MKIEGITAMGPLTPDEQIVVSMGDATTFRSQLEAALLRGHQVYGCFNASEVDARNRDMINEAMQELVDAFIYLGMKSQQLREQDREEPHQVSAQLRRIRRIMSEIEGAWVHLNLYAVVSETPLVVPEIRNEDEEGS